MLPNVTELSMSLLERFVLLMNSRTIDAMEMHEARKQLFTQKSRTLENILPTEAALEQHIKRATYQMWNNASQTLLIGLGKGSREMAATVDHLS